MMRFFSIDRVIEKEGLYYREINIVEKHFSISITPEPSRGESLVIIKKRLQDYHHLYN
jgi:hypothetical protein